MKRLLTKSPLVLIGLCLATLAACVVNLQFDLNRDVPVDAVASTINTVLAFDLTESKEVQDHKGNVQSVGIDSVDATVTALGGGNKATSLTGSLALRPDGATDASHDVQVGQITNPLNIVQGATFHLPGNAAVDQFLFKALQGTGKFSAVIAGSTAGGEAHLTLNVKLHANLGYGTGL